MSKTDFIAPDDVLALAHELALPDCVCESLGKVVDQALLKRHAADRMALNDPDHASYAWRSLNAAFSGKDADGMHLLALYLAAACRAREKYSFMEISDSVFLNTMGCFARFLHETKLRTGHYAFDRGFWAWRQLSCQLFRLGTLEFEYRAAISHESLPRDLTPGSPILSVHIPSDAHLSDAMLQDSYEQAHRFFFEPDAVVCGCGTPSAILCHSWLLAPALRGLLPMDSGILRFQADYEIYAEHPEDKDFFQWLFYGKKALEQLPRDTSLQRTAAIYLAKGGKIGSACGKYVGK